MSLFAYREPGPQLELEADYVVVGSGAGGATAAVTLARAGASVCVVEAGAFREPKDYPTSAYGAMRDLFDDWGSLITRGRAFWPVVQARTAGGTTVINSAIAVRTPDDVFEAWEREHGLVGLAEPWGRIQDQLDQELCTAVVPDAALGTSNQLAVAGARALGTAGAVMRRYVKDCIGSGMCLSGCRAERKQSLNLNYLPEVLARGQDLVCSAPVARIELSGARATGVRGHFDHPVSHLRGAPFFVRARKAVLVAASATHSPVLLRRSGVRHPALGRYFRAHPGTGVFGVYDQIVDMNLGATQGWASVAFRREPGFKLETLSIPPEMAATRLVGAGRTLMRNLLEYRHLAMWVQATRAEAVGTVRPGLFGQPVVRYSLGPNDMQRFRLGMYEVARMHFAAGARAVIPGIYGMNYKLGPDEVGKLLEAPLDPRAYTAILSHLFGGCVFGADPARSVCDERGQVRGYTGLYVADASVLPSTLGVNPQHTIMALARWIAERILAA